MSRVLRQHPALRTIVALGLLYAACFASHAAAQSVTTTSLTTSTKLVAPNCTTATLVASVSSAASPVTVGVVQFLDGSKPIGQVQVVQSSVAGYAPGTATLVKLLGPGPHSITAKFQGTLAYHSSVSAPNALTIAGSTTNTATLYQMTNFSLPDVTTRITLADINGDGLPDILAPLLDSKSIAVFLNDPAFPGHFVPGPNLPMYLQEPAGRVIVTDIDGDGLVDIVVAVPENEGDSDNDYGIVEVFLQDPSKPGTFKAGFITGFDYNFPSDVSVIDMNGDGVPDIVALGPYLFDDNTGHGANEDFQSPSARATFGRDSNSNVEYGDVSTFNIADVDGDGLPDAIFGGLSDHSVSVFYSDPTNPGGFTGVLHFPGPTSSVYRAELLDLDNDGLPDLVFGAGYGGIQTMRNDPSHPGSFLPPVVYPVSDRALGLGIGDINGDGILDVATANGSNSFSVLDGDGKGALGAPTLYTVSAPTTEVDELATADLDGDGFDDVVTVGDVFDGVTLHSSLNLFLHAPTTTITPVFVLSANPTSANFGSSITLTATAASFYGTPTGTAFFSDGIVQLGSSPIGGDGRASISTSVLPVGTQTITAFYSGDATYSSTSATTSVTINSAGNVVLSASPASPTVNQTVTFTAAVSNLPSVGSLSVTFYDKGSPLGSTFTNAGGVATLQDAGLSPGAHAITASCQPPSGSSITSNELDYALTSATTTTLTSSVTNPIISQPFNLTAVVHSSTTGIPTGSVAFSVDGASIGTAPLDATGTATLPASITTSGAHAATATYSGSASYSGSVANLSFTAAQPGFTLSTSQPSLTLTSGGSSSVSIMLNGTAGDAEVVNLACGSLPSTLTCSFSNPNPSVSASTSTTLLTVSTTATYGALESHAAVESHSHVVLAMLPFLLFPWMLLNGKSRRPRLRSGSLFALLLVFVLATVSGCGGGGSLKNAPSPPLPPSAITISVIATGQTTGATHTSSLTIQFQ